MNKKLIGLIVILIVLITSIFNCYTVKTGEVAIVSTFEKKEREAIAKENAIESNSLSPQLLKKMYIEKWDGKLPKIQSNTTPLINMDI